MARPRFRPETSAGHGSSEDAQLPAPRRPRGAFWTPNQNHKIECFFKNRTPPRVVLCYHPPQLALSVAMPCSSVALFILHPHGTHCPCRKEQRRHARCTGTPRRRGGLRCASSDSSSAPASATTCTYGAIAASSRGAAATACASCAKQHPASRHRVYNSATRPLHRKERRCFPCAMKTSCARPTARRARRL